MLSLILFMFALVLFALAGFTVPSPDNPWHNRLVCFGLACMAAAEVAKALPTIVR